MFSIGANDWLRELKQLTEPLGSEFWADFRPASEEQMSEAERQIRRKLDPEFREFYRTVGYGQFSMGGGFDQPEDLIRGAGPAIYFITGSLTPGAEWATEEQHTDLWLSRGGRNPNPSRFTAEALTLDGVKLYDLLQFGSNGSCCYHQLYVGPDPAPLRYCLLTDSQEMNDRASSFSEGLEKIIASYLLEINEDNA
jgi:hypothetical protein